MTHKLPLYIFAVAIAAAYVLQFTSPSLFADTHSTVWRLAYIFHHGGLLHMLANVMCLLAIARSDFRVPWHFLVMSVVVAICSPLGHDATTLGASGVCYALLGAMSWQSIDPKRYHSLIFVFLAAGLLPCVHVNYMLHAFCYIEGLLYGLICSE